MGLEWCEGENFLYWVNRPFKKTHNLTKPIVAQS